MVMRRDTKPFPFLRCVEITDKARIEIRDSSSGMPKWVVSQRSPKTVIDPLPIECRVITDKHRFPFNIFGKPCCKLREHLLFLLHGRLAARYWNRGVLDRWLRLRNTPVECLLGRVDDSAKFS